MAFRYRYSLDGDSVIPVKDYDIVSGQAANVGAGVVVKLDATGKVTPALTGDTAATIAGVSEGTNFEGVGVTAKKAKVRLSKNAVYEADHVGGTPVIGAEYGIDGSSNVDVADTTVKVVKVIDVVGGKPYVKLI